MKSVQTWTKPVCPLPYPQLAASSPKPPSTKRRERSWPSGLAQEQLRQWTKAGSLRLALAWFEQTISAGFTWPVSLERAGPVQASASESGAVLKSSEQPEAAGPEGLEGCLGRGGCKGSPLT